MNIFKNSLNIPDLYSNDTISNTSIVFCYLYATNEKFRNSKKQEIILNKYIDTLQDKITKILNSNSSIKKKLLKFNDDISKTFQDVNSEEFNKDFVFISQTIIEPKVFFIIYNNDAFHYTFNVSDLKPESKIIILNQQGSDFNPIEFNNSYIYYPKNNVLDIIFSFYETKQGKQVSEGYAIVDKELSDNEYTHIHVVDEDDIIFEDFEDNLKIIYKNKDFNQTFSDEEIAIHVQNLLVRLKDSTDSRIYVNLFKETNNIRDILFSPHRVKVANVEKLVDDDMLYIDEFCKFKTAFPTKSFIKSIYFQSNEQKNHANKLLNEHVIRNSMTSTFKLISNDVEIYDEEDCLSMFKKPDLDVIAKAYDISFSNSKKKLCFQLLSHNFIESEILEYYESNYSLQELKLVAEKNDIIIPKTYSKNKIIQKLVEARALTDIHTKKIISDEKILSIIEKYNLPKFDHDEQTYEGLMYANLLNLYSKQDSNNISCEDDLTEDIILEDHSPKSILETYYTFKTLEEDDLCFHGFFQIGNIYEHNYEVFNISNYINILNNLRKFLPVQCELIYHNNNEKIPGEIVSYVQNDNLLKIKVKNEFVYYNLFNIQDNSFFVYTELQDGYRYDKKHLDKNIFFEFHKETYQNVVDIVSFNLKEYLEVVQPALNSLNSINTFLKKFNTTLDYLNNSDYTTLFEYISSNAKLSPKQIDKFDQENDEKTEKKSIYSFLQFSNENRSDVHKMFLLFKNPEFFNIIQSINIELSNSHDLSKTDISFKRNTDPLKPLPIRPNFSTFQEVATYKQQTNSIIEHNNDILLTIRESEQRSYLKNKVEIWKLYTNLLKDARLFTESIHEKQFLNEMNYEIENPYTEHSSNTFINSDPNVQHASLPPVGDTKTESVLSNILKLIGLELSHIEQNYISSQANNRYLPILKVYKQQKNNKKSVSDNTLWTNYSLITIYAAFITLFAQYKFKVSKVYKNCKNIFSLEGYPLNDNEKSFINYLACVLFSIFSKSNVYFQSEGFLSSQITAIIKLIFQQNKALKTKFENLAKQYEQKENTINRKELHIRPYENDNVIQTIESDFSNNTVLNKKTFSIYKSTSKLKDVKYDTFRMYQILCNKRIYEKIIILEKLEKVKFITFDEHKKANDSFYIIDVEVDDNVDDQISDYINNFKNKLGFKIEKFIDTVVINYKEVSSFYHMLKLNSMYMNLIKTQPFFEERKMQMQNYNIKLTTNVQQNVLKCFESVENLLMDLFETEDIYSFMKTEMNAEKRNQFGKFLSTFEIFLNEVSDKISSNIINVDILKKKTEILREEEKQQKLTKYNNLDDDEMFIVMELEKVVGIKVDINSNNENVEEDKDNYVPSQDDDNDEN